MQDASTTAQIDPPASFHVLRHSYASLLAAKGVPLQVVAIALGHSDVRMTTRHYSHLRPDHVAQQIRANLPRFEKKKRQKVARLVIDEERRIVRRYLDGAEQPWA